jgi:hypothetical protein
MKKRSERLLDWLIWGFISTPPVLVTYFYFLLHLGLGVPLKDLLYPSLAACAFMPVFSILTCMGYRARVRGKDGVLMFAAFWVFALLCGFEFRHFEMKIGSGSTSAGFIVLWASTITVGGYFAEKWLRSRSTA